MFGVSSEDVFEQLTVDIVMAMDMSAGQQVWTYLDGATSIIGSNTNAIYSWFSGYLIHAL